MLVTFVSVTEELLAAMSNSSPAISKVHNFSAGPAILPQEVLAKAAEACRDFAGLGLSLLEISHRSKPFVKVMDEAIELAPQLLGFSDDYAALFIGGGASTQFFQVAANLLPDGQTAHYLDTGTWANKAIKEAKRYGKVNVVASSKDSNYNFIPKNYEVPQSGAYFHITSNNTIFGTQQHQWPETSLPIVADMSSDIFSRPIPAEKFGLIYAGAQKNMGPAGVTLVIVRKDLLGRHGRDLPTMVDYRTHIDNGSMFNTPPVFPVYVSLLTMQWVRDNGGVEAMAQRNEAKANLLYGEIDRNPLFKPLVATEDRSQMNVCFDVVDENHRPAFEQLAREMALDGLPGHRSVGGYRASIYNAMDISSVEVLVEAMRELERTRG